MEMALGNVSGVRPVVHAGCLDTGTFFNCLSLTYIPLAFHWPFNAFQAATSSSATSRWPSPRHERPRILHESCMSPPFWGSIAETHTE